MPARQVSLSYGYVPQDIAQAALELAAERFRAAERIGLRSKSVGGQETIGYDTSADILDGAGASATLSPRGDVMLTLGLAGGDALDARLGAFPADSSPILPPKPRLSPTPCRQGERRQAVRPGSQCRSSGDLRASIVSEVGVDGDGVIGSVGSAGDVKYAAIQEYGGKTAAHEILPSKADALAFLVGGAIRFARRIEHPGSVIPERSYLRSSLAEMTDEIVEALGGAPADVWER